jgi:uncharacterized protein YjdB
MKVTAPCRSVYFAISIISSVAYTVLQNYFLKGDFVHGDRGSKLLLPLGAWAFLATTILFCAVPSAFAAADGDAAAVASGSTAEEVAVASLSGDASAGDDATTQKQSAAMAEVDTTDLASSQGSVAPGANKSGFSSSSKSFAAVDKSVLPSSHESSYDSSALSEGSATGSNDSADTMQAPDDEKVSTISHVSNIGWQRPVTTTKDTVADAVPASGITGQGKAVEAVKISVAVPSGEGGIEYSAYARDAGWMEASNGVAAGTTGQSRPIEAFYAQLTGKYAKTHSIWYRLHVSNIGWLGWAHDGELAGAPAQGEQVEALQVLIRLIEESMPNNGAAYRAPAGNVVVQAHVQNDGWLSSVGDGGTAGTTGRSLHLEAIKVQAPNEKNLSVAYSAHVAEIGWQPYVSNGQMAGTTGRNLAMQALRMKLSGNDAAKYSIWYRVHVANVGWLNWAKDDAEVGSVGLSMPLEALQVFLVKKGNAEPASNGMLAFIPKPSVSYVAHVASIGWQNWVANGATAGTTGRNLAVEALKVHADAAGVSGGISTQVHAANIGWMGAVAEDAVAGTTGQSRQLEAVKLTLTGELSKYYDIVYRVHVANHGWLDWARDGAAAGTTGIVYSLQAIEVKLIGKGTAAPGATARPYTTQRVVTDAVRSNMDGRAQGFSSRTGWLIMVDRGNARVGIYTGWQGHWTENRYVMCTPGKPSTQTITGTYTTQYRKPHLSDTPSAMYCTNIWGGYFFHSILRSTSELGNHLSHGCIRMNWPDAYFIYTQVPLGTTVNIYN